MRKQIYLISCLALFSCALIAQDIVSLQGCYDDAKQAHPLSKQKQLLSDIWQIEDRNLASSWYPSIDAGANFLYNTNVVDLNKLFESLPLKGLPSDIVGMPNDQYKLTLDVNQTIWDGGITKNKRKYTEKEFQKSKNEVDTEIYKIRQSINNSYFGIILMKRQKELLNLYLKLVNSSILTAESAYANGYILESEKNTMLAERIIIIQQINECDIKLSALYKILSKITAKDIGANSKLVLPIISLEKNISISRPEFMIIESQIAALDARKELIKGKRAPKAFAFATLGYGSPAGNDFFSSKFAPYSMFGAGLKWNIFDWNNAKRSKQKIDFNINIALNNKVNVEENFNRALINKFAEIQAFETLLESDKELIKLRKSITASSESQFKNGSITATGYMKILNLEKEAVLSQTIHSLSYIKAKVEYLNISGNEIE